MFYKPSIQEEAIYRVDPKLHKLWDNLMPNERLHKSLLQSKAITKESIPNNMQDSFLMRVGLRRRKGQCRTIIHNKRRREGKGSNAQPNFNYIPKKKKKDNDFHCCFYSSFTDIYTSSNVSLGE